MGFTVTDNADGTGATAAITAGTPSGAYSVLARRSDLSETAVVAAGTADGSGALTLACPVPPLLVGYPYFFSLAPSAGGGERLVTVTGAPGGAGADATHYRILVAVVGAILDANLAGMAGRVYLQLTPNPTPAQFPCVFVTPGAVPERIDRQDQGSYTVDYPVSVAVADRCDPDYTAALPAYLKWREQLTNLFAFTALSLPAGSPAYQRTYFEPSATIDVQANDYQYVLSGFTLFTRVLKARGG